MNVTIYPGITGGSVDVPASKSYAQRAVLIAALAREPSVIRNLTLSDDIGYALQSAKALGAEVSEIGSTFRVVPGRSAPVHTIFAGESGLSARILASVLITRPGWFILDGAPALRRRPFKPIIDVADQLGISVIQGADGKLPLQFEGNFETDSLIVDGALSSQFATGLLIALSAIGYKGDLQITNLNSRPYLEITVDILKDFGISWHQSNNGKWNLQNEGQLTGADYTVEADWSAAAALVPACIRSREVTLEGLNSNSIQPDKSILDVIPGLSNSRGANVQIRGGEVNAFSFDANQSPDLFPPLVSIAIASRGKCEIHGTGRLHHKESDRALSLQSEYRKLGIRIDLSGDVMIIHPGSPQGGIVESHGDHRIAMSLAATALNASGPVTIQGAESVSKSYPGFFKDLEGLGVRMEFEH